ncbi:Crp/Fnr family transcriptional regulator [Treponema sp. C6A8]|uniref:Crp/Fnr family transcriptional regulator n=1 Tax=Treponema sp. C6A8 TaxID=1410609 RepID=UPI00048070EB|nr:Crp/Fnr family transcriptional regulator [Treponema sp. C6A8]
MTSSDIKALIPFFEELTPQQIDLILQSAQEKTLDAGNIISTGGGSCQGFIIVKDGLIGASMVSEDGREAELFELNVGETCILSASCIFLPKAFHVQMTAEKTSRVIIIPSSTVEKLREQNIHVELFAYKTMTARFANVMQAVEELLFVPVEKRLAKMLLRLGKREPSPTAILITQDALAKKLGTAREVVSRTLSSLKDRGILEVGRGQIRITKPSLLQELALK